MSQAHFKQAKLSNYVIGFVLSLATTLGAYYFVSEQMFSGMTLVAAIIVLAIAQLIIQLVCFLHLGKESNPRWNLITFLLMLVILFTIVGGSLWIMNNLNYHMMPPHTVDEQMKLQSDKGF